MTRRQRASLRKFVSVGAKVFFFSLKDSPAPTSGGGPPMGDRLSILSPIDKPNPSWRRPKGIAKRPIFEKFEVPLNSLQTAISGLSASRIIQTAKVFGAMRHDTNLV